MEAERTREQQYAIKYLASTCACSEGTFWDLPGDKPNNLQGLGRVLIKIPTINTRQHISLSSNLSTVSDDAINK
eukprot:scaffold4641_cov114-Skeletonema_marinoi.AAC.2